MLLIDVIERADMAILRCRGGLLAGETVERFRAIALRYSDSLLLIDVSALEKIDAAGVGGLLDVHKTAERNGGTVIISDPTVWVRECLRLTRVKTVLHLVSSAELDDPARFDCERPVHLQCVAG